MAYQHPYFLPSPPPGTMVLKRGETYPIANSAPFSSPGVGLQWRVNVPVSGETATNLDPKGWSVSLVGGEVQVTVSPITPYGSLTLARLYYGLHEDHSTAGSQFQVATNFDGTIRGGFFYVRNVRPVASFTYSQSGNTINVDASASSDEDSAGIAAYQWDWDGDGTFDESTSEPTASHTYDEEGEYTVKLRVLDMDGGESLIVAGEAVAAAGGRFGSFVDATGALYSAVNDGDNVQVSRFRNGVASRELLAVIANAKNPSLTWNPSRNVQLLSYEDTSDGAQKLVVSRISGRAFS